ncbi:MAG: hypothetical protein IT438_16365 [Phycisphaerales bacterium]|nr:hypothetical protein [Phycisphaerales bacterium]
MTDPQHRIKLFAFGVRACGCKARGRHQQGCPAVAERRRQLRLAKLEAAKPKQPEPPPTRYKVPPRPERPSNETPVGWMPTVGAKGSGLGVARRKGC